METLEQIWAQIVAYITTSGWNIVKFLAVFAAGIIIIRLAITLLRRALIKSPLSKTLANFVLQVARLLLYLLLFFTLVQILGLSMAPLVTALGSVALAIGLALKDSLSNLANGVVLMGTKPFAEGDYVKIGDVEGTVKSIHMMTTELVTADNKKVTVPNAAITSTSVIDYSAKPTRRLEWKFCVSYDSDIDTVKRIILDELNAHELVLKIPAPMARLTEQGDSSLVFVSRAWVNNSDYWDVNFDINERVFKAFNREGIEIPYNQLDVHIRNGETAENPNNGSSGQSAAQPFAKKEKSEKSDKPRKSHREKTEQNRNDSNNRIDESIIGEYEED